MSKLILMLHGDSCFYVVQDLDMLLSGLHLCEFSCPLFYCTYSPFPKNVQWWSRDSKG